MTKLNNVPFDILNIITKSLDLQTIINLQLSSSYFKILDQCSTLQFFNNIKNTLLNVDDFKDNKNCIVPYLRYAYANNIDATKKIKLLKWYSAIRSDINIRNHFIDIMCMELFESLYYNEFNIEFKHLSFVDEIIDNNLYEMIDKLGNKITSLWYEKIYYKAIYKCKSDIVKHLYSHVTRNYGGKKINKQTISNSLLIAIHTNSSSEIIQFLLDKLADLPTEESKILLANAIELAKGNNNRTAMQMINDVCYGIHYKHNLTGCDNLTPVHDDLNVEHVNLNNLKSYCRITMERYFSLCEQEKDYFDYVNDDSDYDDNVEIHYKGVKYYD